MVKKNYSKVKGVAERIAQALLESGLSQAEVASKLNVFPTAISRWKTGATEPTPSNINALAKALKVDVNWLMKGEVPKKITNPDKNAQESEEEEMYRIKFEEAQEKIIGLLEENNELRKKIADLEPEKKSRASRKVNGN